MFKHMRDMKAKLEGAPVLAGQAQQLAVAQQGSWGQQQMPWDQQAPVNPMEGWEGTEIDIPQATGAEAGDVYEGPEFEPVVGVSLAVYAAIVKESAEFGHDPAMMAELAAGFGISDEDWPIAVAGWNARFHTHPAVAQRFNQSYREA